MDLENARECLAAARGDPVVAAWIIVLKQYDLPPNTPMAPEEFWGTYEQLYCNDLIDDDQYYNDETAERIRAGRKSIKPNQIHDALGRLAAIRAPKGDDMSGKPDDLFADDHALVPTSTGRSGNNLAHTNGFNGNGVTAAALFAESPNQNLFHNEPPSPPDLFFDQRQSSLELGPVTPSPSALACTSMESGQPFDVKLNIKVTCMDCNRVLSFVKEDAKGLLDSAEYVSAEDSGEETDIAEFVSHGRCDGCQTTICLSAIKPVMRGTMGRIG